ncbi:DUF4920 domain-containing protein, partial [Flavobacteriaceae bacterium]|nr:DUF4920 domain-containing protein [Flavobacteriaceae bacterium]
KMKYFSLVLVCFMITNVLKSQTQNFGDDLTEGALSDLKKVELLYNSEGVFNTKFKAVVVEVCQAKGCWMKLDLGEDKEVMVKFKDYGFFVPKDIVGRDVIVEGEAYKEVTTIDELKHYADDLGDSKEKINAITQAEEVRTLTANGVVVLPQK